nr:hypothetical protein [Candidatus Brachybacter algidus]
MKKTLRAMSSERRLFMVCEIYTGRLTFATYLGFTGTPIESTDVNTPAVFGSYVDIYDIAQAVEDGATVRIFYESRLAKVNLSETGRKLLMT